MKKLLLGSTALVVGGLMAAPAMAADPIKLGVGGYYTFYAIAGRIDSTYAFDGTYDPSGRHLCGWRCWHLFPHSRSSGSLQFLETDCKPSTQFLKPRPDTERGQTSRSGPHVIV